MAGPHYVTRRLLKEFGGDDLGLRELVKATGEVKPRVSLDNAGSEVGIWPEDIERGPLQQWDNRAHKILGPKIYGRRGIRLTPDEHEIIQEWMFAFLLRSPANRRMCEAAHQNATLTAHTRDGIVAENYSNPWLVTRNYAIKHPGGWLNFMQRYGQFNTEMGFLRNCRIRVYSGVIERQTSGTDTFHSMLRHGVEPYLNIIRRMRWTWLHSIGDFVIGDNPFCRSNTPGTVVDYPLGREDLVVTFPFGRHLCLMLHHNPLYPYEMELPNEWVQRINRVQIASAEAKVWGPRESSLRLDASSIPRHPIDITLETAGGNIVVDRV